MALTFGSLFAGIGGFDLGLERAGLQCRWQVEIDPYCQKVLAKHWPNIKRWDDVRTFPPADGNWQVDLIAGGFPCQDISCANPNGEGLQGARSGLFFEIVRVARCLRPTYLLLENVSALLVRGLDTVLGELAALGYDAQWHCIPAASVGAPHRRDRIFMLALAGGQRRQQLSRCSSGSKTTHERRSQNEDNQPAGSSARLHLSTASPEMADSFGDLVETARPKFVSDRPRPCSWWETEPNVGRVVDGLPRRVDRIRCLGNAVVPQIVEYLGEQLMMHDDLNNACNLVFDRTGLVPEVASAEELTAALLEWGDALAFENQHLRQRIEELESTTT